VCKVHAVTIEHPGEPDVLVWSEVPDPEPAPGEVIVEVAASAVNRADIMQRQGNYPPPPGASPYPGLECAGVIAEVGSEVDAAATGWQVGDQVCALLAGGGYAERVAVPVGQLLPVPDGVPLVEAAGLPEVACTVWSNVVTVGRLAAGEVLLVHGASSGVGTMAVQVGVALGARVVGTASAAKHDAVRKLGAERLVDYRTEDFVAVVRELTGGRGADVVLDVMGAAYLDRNTDVLARGGRLVVIGLQGGIKAELDLARLLGKRASVTATALRSRPLEEKAAIVRDVREHLWPLIAAGRVTPVIDSRVPMADAAEGHRRVGAGEHVGKVLLMR
jgi:putative PIG3 family NAD(P)H quinone oxidoreductase